MKKKKTEIEKDLTVDEQITAPAEEAVEETVVETVEVKTEEKPVAPVLPPPAKDVDPSLKQWEAVHGVTQTIAIHFEKITERLEKITFQEQKTQEAVNRLHRNRVNPFIFGMSLIAILFSLISMVLAQSARQAILMPANNPVVSYQPKQQVQEPVQTPAPVQKKKVHTKKK